MRFGRRKKFRVPPSAMFLKAGRSIEVMDRDNLYLVTRKKGSLVRFKVTKMQKMYPYPYHRPAIVQKYQFQGRGTDVGYRFPSKRKRR